MFAGVAAAAGLLIATPPTLAAVLQDQLAPSAQSVSSHNFEPGLDNFDSLGADDFVVPAGEVWRIDLMEVSGQRTGNTTEAATANLSLFGDAGTLPGTEILTRSNLARGTGPAYPDLVLPLSDMPVLPPGRYWIGVQANLNFMPGANNWFWSDHAPALGQAAAWRQPGNGFGDGCTSFITRSACASYPGSGGEPDQAFRLSGDTASSSLDLLTAKVKRRGKVKLTVNAPNVGELVVAGKKLKTARAQVTEIGTATLVTKAKRAVREKLEDGKRVKVKVVLTLPPLQGQTLKATEKIKLKP